MIKFVYVYFYKIIVFCVVIGIFLTVAAEYNQAVFNARRSLVKSVADLPFKYEPKSKKFEYVSEQLHTKNSQSMQGDDSDQSDYNINNPSVKNSLLEIDNETDPENIKNHVRPALILPEDNRRSIHIKSGSRPYRRWLFKRRRIRSLLDRSVRCKNDCQKPHEVCQVVSGEAVCRCKVNFIRIENDCLPITTCEDFPCFNDGLCEDTEDGQYICHCPLGYKGRLCDIEIPECEDASCSKNEVCLSTETGFKCQKISV